MATSSGWPSPGSRPAAPRAASARPPRSSATRWRSFLARALELTGPAPNAFTDDNGNTHEANINRLAASGITSGCGPNLYCPGASVRRDQMASFLARALELTGPAPNAFTDDNGNTHEANINRLKAAGVTDGCGGTKYCPTANVTRGQMAAFLRRAFE